MTTLASVIVSILVVVFIFLYIANVKEGHKRLESDSKLGALQFFAKHKPTNESFQNTTYAISTEEQFINIISPSMSRDIFETTWSQERSAFTANDHIYLDWNIDSSQFTYLHYKALESALIAYPKAKFTLLIVGPNAANYYKINDLISKHQFQKYKKRGYHISPEVVDSVQAPLGSALTMEYWARQQPVFCSTKGKKHVHDVNTAPYHAWFYVRLHKLLGSGGGLSFDFSWLHTKPLSSHLHFGFKMSTVCTLVTATEERGEAQTREEEVHLSPSSSLSSPFSDPAGTTSSDERRSYKDCYTSSFMVLRKRFLLDLAYKNIILCALTRYDEEESNSTDTLAACFARDQLTGGALCLEIVMTECFAKHAPNQLSSNDAGSSIQMAVVETFDWRSENASHWQQLPLQSTDSASQHFVYQVSTYLNLMSAAHPDLVSSCADTSGWQDNTALTTSPNINSFHTSAIWLGRNVGVTGRSPSGRNASLAPQANVVPFTKWESERAVLDWFVPSSRSVLHHLIETLGGHLCRDVKEPSVGAGAGVGSCAHFSVSQLTRSPPPPPPEWGRSLPAEPAASSFELSRAGLSCSINFVVPGFMKCASSFLFEALTNHPQVLRALKGVNFKETGCYLPPSRTTWRADSPSHRMNCFPFIEQHESRYIYGDATVTYSANYDVPYFLQQDNPSVKSIFVVRRPISRTESHFRYSLGLFTSLGFDTVDKAIAFALRNESRLHALREEAVALVTYLEAASESSRDVTSGDISLAACLASPWVLFFHFDECVLLGESSHIEASVMREKNKIYKYVCKFFVPGGVKTREDRLTNSIIHISIYFPVIAHWSRVLRPENILVIENEKLKITSEGSRVHVAKEMKKIHRFLNIFEHDKSVPGRSVHKTAQGAEASVTSRAVRKSLQEFFSPFNELLFQLVEVAGIATYDINYNVHD